MQLRAPRSVPVRLAGLVVALVALLGSGTAWAAVNPIDPANRPTSLPGMTNGNLPASELYVQGPRCAIYAQAAGSFVEMLAAAQAAGVALGPSQCYRDYAGQVYWRTYWCNLGLCGNAAVPGTSNHGWGKAVDLRDQYGGLTWDSPGYHWMVAHGGEFGFNHPGGVDEAWHWEWVGDGGTLRGWPVRTDLWVSPVHGLIYLEWAARGAGAGFLGYALTSERTTPDRIGRYNHFTGGSVYWTPSTGAHEVHGAIRDRWAAVGWEQGPLGYPYLDETVTADRIGRWNAFERGTVYWSPATGAHEVHGAIGETWTALGRERGALGYPLTDEYAVSVGMRNDFQHGSITWNRTTGAVTVTRR